MFELDKLAQHFKMRILESGDGYAKLSMLVAPEMLNALNICHGGVTFALADTAFAYACNSGNIKTVALSCLISYSQAVKEGDMLFAECVALVQNKSTGTYDVKVSNQDGQVVALFRGTSYSTRQQLFSE